MKIKRTLIVGGTHGNELTGIYLVKKFEREPQLIQRESFETCTLLANEKAYEIGKRYVDTDLNRCFQSSCLNNLKLSSYEAQRAKVIHQTFGTGGNRPADLVVDLHSTTSNMGLTIILASKKLFNLQLAAYLCDVNPKVKVLYSAPKTLENLCYLHSICEFGCTIEVGAIAQGILDARLFQQTEKLVHEILDYVQAYNQGVPPQVRDPLTVYQSINALDFPRNKDGEVQGMIHPRLQFADYKPIHPGEPIFLTFDGDEIVYEGKELLIPVFLNESAYYEKGVAMLMTRPENFSTKQSR